MHSMNIYGMDGWLNECLDKMDWRAGRGWMGRKVDRWMGGYIVKRGDG